MSLLENYLSPSALIEFKAARLIARARQQGTSAPADWRERLSLLFASYLWHDFSPPHVALWEWATAIQAGQPARPFVALWPRGRGKSTHAEMISADLGARGTRRYCLYVCETQDQADKHVGTIQHMLESAPFGRHFPQVGAPRFGKHGSRTWRRGVMSAANGYTVEAIGLDKAIRGQKIDWARPDLIILDDVDARHDSEAAVKRKEDTVTTSILPSAADHAAVLFVQNVIHEGSIAHRLSKPSGQPGAADYLSLRVISGPFPAVEGLAYAPEAQADGSTRWRITAGASLWAGYDLALCEEEINRAGPSAFELESQHAIDSDNPAALLTSAVFDRTRVMEAPPLVEVVIGVDPSGGAGQVGIVGVGKALIGRTPHGYTIGDFSTPPGASADVWARAVLRAYHVLKADRIVVERNFGGDMVRETIRNATYRADDGDAIDGRTVHITEVVASRGKAVRAAPVSVLYEQGRAHHVGRWPELQRQWTRWTPDDSNSPDRLDAEVWAYTNLFINRGAGAI